MSPMLLTTIGIIGNALLALSYIPQILKILRTKKAEDLSLLMWLAYLIGDILLTIYAWYTGDIIFTILFILFTIGNFTILALSVRYSNYFGEAH